MFTDMKANIKDYRWPALPKIKDQFKGIFYYDGRCEKRNEEAKNDDVLWQV
jgi:hypothetical protein